MVREKIKHFSQLAVRTTTILLNIKVLCFKCFNYFILFSDLIVSFYLLLYFICLGGEEGGNFTLKDVSVLAVGMAPTDEYYISFTSSGIFTLENVMIGMAEPFASWAPHSKAFNSSYLYLLNGEYVIKNVDFVGMVVGKGYTFIDVDVSESHPLHLLNCSFDSCGCVETGYSIHVVSSSLSDSVTLLVSDCTFTSCIGSNGGAFRFSYQ
jgi:hypothetical protein